MRATAAVAGCPGLFKGAIPLRLPVSCDALHALFGALAGLAGDPRVRRALGALFVAYQVVEELPHGDVRAFVWDTGVFAAGYLVGSAVRWAAERRGQQRSTTDDRGRPGANAFRPGE